MFKNRAKPPHLDITTSNSIAVKLTGGTGNQLFGFFTAYAIAQSLGCHVIVELSNFSYLNPRAFSLHNLLNDKFRVGSSSGYFLIRETSFNFSTEILSTPKGCVLDGYFQSYKYFQIYRNEIIEFFEQSVNLKSLPAHQKRIILHARRGDYTKKLNLKVHGLCSFDYYINAVTHIRQHLGFLPVEVFSDDSNYAEQLTQVINNSYVSHHETPWTDLEVIRYMSTAQGYVLSNSTFGWWAAWLNRQNESPTVCPDPWFTNRSIDTADLLPRHWVKLSR